MNVSDVFTKEFIAVIEEQLVRGPLADTEGEIEYVDAKQFLCANRIDLVPKIYYIECRENNFGLDFARELYIEHIKSITNGEVAEVWDTEKSGIETYLQRFDVLIDDIKTNGFDEKKSVVPIGLDNGIIDGAHRTAIAIYFGIKLPVFRLHCNSWANGYKAFLYENRVKITEKYMDFIAFQYMKYKSPCYMALIWPISYNNPNYPVAIKLLEECCSVVYKKEVFFSYNGLTQLAIHAYFESEWAGGFEKNFPGIPGVVNERYAPNAPVTVVLIDGSSLEEVQKIKKIIRIVLGGGFCRIHITDTQAEAIRMGKMLLNENSINFLNQSYILRYPEFTTELLKFREKVLADRLQDDVCIDTGGVMAVYGLRNSNDIDYLSVKGIDLQGYDRHTQHYYDITSKGFQIERIIYNWFEHFYCFDMMFNSLDNVGAYKTIRGEEKDKRDVLLIQVMQTECPYEAKYLPIPQKMPLNVKIKRRIWNVAYRVTRIVKRIIGEKMYRHIRNFIHKLGK